MYTLSHLLLYDSRDYINYKKWVRLIEQVVVEGKLRNGGWPEGHPRTHTPGKSYSDPGGINTPSLPPFIFFFSSFFISPHPHTTKNISSNISSIPYLPSGLSLSTGIFHHQLKPYHFFHPSTSISDGMKPTVTMPLRHWPSSLPHASHVRLVFPSISDFVPSLHWSFRQLNYITT